MPTVEEKIKYNIVEKSVELHDKSAYDYMCAKSIKRSQILRIEEKDGKRFLVYQKKEICTDNWADIFDKLAQKVNIFRNVYPTEGYYTVSNNITTESNTTADSQYVPIYNNIWRY